MKTAELKQRQLRADGRRSSADRSYKFTIAEAGTHALAEDVDQDSERFFQNDAMNRQTVVDAIDAAGNLGTQGHRIAYDQNGNRASDTWWGHRVGAPDGLTTEQYGYDAMNRLSSIVRDGVLTDERKYDAASRVVSTGPSGSLPAAYAAALNGTDWRGEALAGNGSETRINRYDANGRITRQDVFASDNSPKATVFYDRPAPMADVLFPQVGSTSGYDAAGNLLGYTVVDQQAHTVTNYANSYEATRAYRQASTLSTASHASPGVTQFSYQDEALVAVRDVGEPRNDRTFVNDMDGRVLASTQNGAVQRQLVVNGEVLGRYGMLRDEANPVSPFDGAPRFEPRAEFSFGYQPISGSYPSASPGTYAVAAGDSLKGIARGAYGDESLWYLIAEANGLTSDADLKAGQVLTVPARVTSANSADTFRPYDPTQAIGDTSPTALPSPQAGDGACGGFGDIIVLAVVVFVAAVSQQWYLTQFTGSTAGAAAASTGAQIAAGAAAAATGSVAGQLVGQAIGTQSSFSWKQMALAAVSGGVSGGLTSVSFGTGSVVGDAIVRGAVSSALTQGLAVATGLQPSFSWRAVAASAAGSGVGAGLNEAMGITSNGARVEGLSFANRIARGTVSAFGSGLTVAAMRGGRVSATQVATDAFGNALGDSLAAANGQQATQNQSAWDQRHESYQQMGRAFGDAGSVTLFDGSSVSAAENLLRANLFSTSAYASNDVGEPSHRTVSDAGSGGFRSGITYPAPGEDGLPSRWTEDANGLTISPLDAEPTANTAESASSRPFEDFLNPRALAPYNSQWQAEIVRNTLITLAAEEAERSTPGMRAWNPQIDAVRTAQQRALGNYLNGQGSMALGGVAASVSMVASRNLLAASMVTDLAAPIDSLIAPMGGGGRIAGASGQRRMGRLGLVPNAALETERVLQGDASRSRIVGEIGKAAQTSIEALLRLDPNAQIGFRGSLAAGLKGEHKIDTNGNRVAFDGDVAFKLNRRTGQYETYTGGQGYDADFFVVSDKLAAQLGNRRDFMDAARLNGGALVQVFDAFGKSMQLNPVLSGMKAADTTFRVWTQDAINRKLQGGDAQIYFLTGGQR